MAVETLTHVYTSQGEIERIAFGETGSPIAVNDIAAGESIEDRAIEVAIFWVEITEEASDFINEFAEMRYSPVDLVDSRWVRSRAAWIGAYLLSQRRGNPALFLDRFDEITDELQRVADGRILIPRLPTRENFAPSMSNLVIHDYFNVHKIRVHPSISVGGAGANQDISPVYPWEWLILLGPYLLNSLPSMFC